jgi:hypothetical protein
VLHNSFWIGGVPPGQYAPQEGPARTDVAGAPLIEFTNMDLRETSATEASDEQACTAPGHREGG